MDKQVECRSEVTYAERPIALHWQGQRLLVSKVLVRWRVPQGARFRVSTEDDQVFEVEYNEASDTWLVVLI